jgi:hypothetical protein
MFTLEKYIAQNLKDADKLQYSSPYWATSDVNGIVTVDYSAQGCKAIFFGEMVLANTTGAPQTIIISDSLGKTPLFTISILANDSKVIAPWYYCSITNQVRLLGNNANIVYSVMYQYLTHYGGDI